MTKRQRRSKSKVPPACTIYDLLGAYADVLKRKAAKKRRVGKHPALAAPYGTKAIRTKSGGTILPPPGKEQDDSPTMEQSIQCH